MNRLIWGHTLESCCVALTAITFLAVAMKLHGFTEGVQALTCFAFGALYQVLDCGPRFKAVPREARNKALLTPRETKAKGVDRRSAADSIRDGVAGHDERKPDGPPQRNR